MGNQASLSGIPWPGPRPYEEEEWKLFFGRKREVLDLHERIGGGPLTVLAGRSGSGKTSLMRAGVLPALRLRRYEVPKPRVGPVVLLRDWGGAGKYASVEEVIRAGLDQALTATGSWTEKYSLARKDFSGMKAALDDCGKEESSVEVFAKLMQSIEEDPKRGVICIFDQFEEILRLGREVARDAVVIVRDLLRAGIGLRLVLALREEYLSDLRGLERSVGGVFGQTYFLLPLRWEAAKEVVNGVAAAAKIGIEENVLDSIFKWLGHDLSEGYSVDQEPRSRDSAERGEAVDLLRMQAILFQLAADYLEGSVSEPEGRKLTTGSLRSYQDDFGPSEDDVVRNTLTRWVERAFEEGSQADLHLDHKSPRESFQRLIERLAVRIGPHLSSAGYKVSQEESDLFRKAVGEDVWALGLMDSRLRLEMEVESEQEGQAPHLDSKTISALTGDARTSAQFLSGIALEEGWTRLEAAQELLWAFLGALRELREGNILKLGYSSEGRKKVVPRWELVHDGLGEPLISWARGRRDSWEDCIASVAVCRGVSPVGVHAGSLAREPTRRHEREENVLGFLRWEGCQVAAVTIGEKVILRDIVFKQCVFRGTIFEGIIFLRCEFVECDLSGTVFRDCVFGDLGESAEKVDFKRCDPASLAILDCRIRRLFFEGCNLSQLTVKGCQVEGALEFSGGSVVLSYFGGIGHAENIVIGEGVNVVYSGGDSKSWKKMRFMTSNITGGAIDSVQ